MILLSLALTAALTACGGTGAPAGNDTTARKEPAATQPAPDGTDGSETDAAAGNSEAAGTEAGSNRPGTSGTLVIFFSATGTTRTVAQKIAAIEGADLYEITAAVPYTSADLDWTNSGSRATQEQNDSSVRPALGGERISLEGYSTIYIGFPIWWGEEPRIMDTFAESYRFDGITVIPFCTSGSSGIGRSDKNLAEKAGSGNWKSGRRFSGSVSESELRTWIDSLK